jgi:predicted ATPase
MTIPDQLIEPRQRQPSAIRRMVLDDFKGFKHAELAASRFTVVVGTNAAGKSNLRDAFRFIHGIARGYTLAEIIGEKWIEGGVLQWRGIRGGTREATYPDAAGFTIEVSLDLPDDGVMREATYRIRVELANGKPPRVAEERLLVRGKGQFIFDSHPDNNAPPQDDSRHLNVRLKKQAKKGFYGKVVSLIADRPAITQLLDHKDVKLKDVRDFAELTIEALRSMRFLDLSPDAMRLPSIPGQVILGDRGENLSSVLEAICADPARKDALTEWLRQLTPLDVVDFRFPQDAAGRVLMVLVEADGREISAYSASDGTLRFLSMIAAFLGPDPARFYFFEELETGLHPTRLHLLLELIETQASRGFTQVIATTHSPQLLTLLGPQALESAVLAYRLHNRGDQRLIRIVELPDARRVLAKHDLTRLHATGWLEDAAEFGENNVNGASVA